MYFLAHNSTKIMAMMLKITEILGIIEWMMENPKTPSFCIIGRNFDRFLRKMAVFHKNAFFSKTVFFLFLHRKCVSHFSPLLHNNLLMLRNNGEKIETEWKIKIPSSNFCSPLISARCVQISAQKLHFLWRNKKRVFLRNMHFCVK